MTPQQEANLAEGKRVAAERKATDKAEVARLLKLRHTVQTAARYMGISERTVQRYRKELECATT
jgi:DNA-binding CsgD family transcriptional regulator